MTGGSFCQAREHTVRHFPHPSSNLDQTQNGCCKSHVSRSPRHLASQLSQQAVAQGFQNTLYKECTWPKNIFYKKMEKKFFLSSAVRKKKEGISTMSLWYKAVGHTPPSSSTPSEYSTILDSAVSVDWYPHKTLTMRQPKADRATGPGERHTAYLAC